VVAHLTDIKRNSMNKTDWTLARRGSKFSWKRGFYNVVSISDGGLWVLESVLKPPYYSAKNPGNGSNIVLHAVKATERKKVWPRSNIEVNVFVDGDFRWIIYSGKNGGLFTSPSYKIDDLKKGESFLFKGENVRLEGRNCWLPCERECLGIGLSKIRYKDPHYETLAVALLIFSFCYRSST
jgi:hypothetical protein